MHSERTTGDLKKAPEAGDQAKIRMMPRRGTWLMKPLAMLLSIAWVLAIIVRLTVRDSGGTISTLIFYMSPLMLLSVGAALITGVTLWVRWYRLALIWLLLTLFSGVWCYQAQFQTHVVSSQLPAANQFPLRVLFWNIGDRIWSVETMVQEVKRIDADLVAFVEAESYTQGDRDFWKRTFPEYPCQEGQDGFLLLSRLPCTSRVSGSLGRMGRYLKVSLLPVEGIKVNANAPPPITACLVDINSDVFRSRQEALQKLANLVAENAAQPVLILGDFNTPGDSVHFQPLRKLCRNSFEEAGNGYNATWPLPLPVLALDGIWVNPFVEVGASENLWTWYSDHRPVVVDLILRPEHSKAPASL